MFRGSLGANKVHPAMPESAERHRPVKTIKLGHECTASGYLFRRALLLVEYPAVTILKFLIFSEQGLHIFILHWILQTIEPAQKTIYNGGQVFEWPSLGPQPPGEARRAICRVSCRQPGR